MQAFPGCAKKGDVGVETQPPLWGVVGRGALAPSRIGGNAHEMPGIAGVELGGDPLQTKLPAGTAPSNVGTTSYCLGLTFHSGRQT